MVQKQFNFGCNWKAFSEHALTAASVEQAKKDFLELLSGIELSEQSFLDIGFGQGLTLLVATSMGAKTVGCDINPLCPEVLQKNQKRYFPELSGQSVPMVVGSILDPAVVESLRTKSPDRTTRAYQIVHSWGVLHHTGEMKRAIQIAASLVEPQGHLIIAIYAHHWSSRTWKVIKRFYNNTPATIQRQLIRIFYPMIYVAKWLVTRSNPLKPTRGMSFYYDVVDWVGGYPYEYATVEETKRLLESEGFRLRRCIPAAVPTGCNQFVFERA